ncbi:MAG: O-antigen ligase family protein [Acidobacteriota bacterium]
MTRQRTSVAPIWRRSAFLSLAVLILLPPFVFVPTAFEAFRTPKLLLSLFLAMVSLLCLSWALRDVERVSFAGLWKLPALRAALPLVALAGLSWFTTEFREVTGRAIVALTIGAASLVGWSVGLSDTERNRALGLLYWSATALSALALLQASGLYRPLAMVGGKETSRMGITSLAGNAGDLAAYLVLPCLLLQGALRGSSGTQRIRNAILLAVLVLTMAVTQTFTALAALLVGSLLFWAASLPLRRTLRSALATLALAAALVLLISPLRQRALGKVHAISSGDWNQVLTYRLDAWRAATWMLGQHPIEGVGHGAYRSHYAEARLALTAEGKDFSGPYRQFTFSNAHNDVLEVAAELGVPGLLALAWATWTLISSWRRRPGEERPLALAALASLALLAMGTFPFETALLIFPWLLFLSGVLRPAPLSVEIPEPQAVRPARRGR